MTQEISIVPVAAEPHLSLDLVRHFVAQILAVGGGANFVDGVVDNTAADPAQITLYPHYLEDKPDAAGVIRVEHKAPSPENPMRFADVTVAFRLPKITTAGTTFSAQKRATQAAEALFQWLRPSGGIRTETDSTLPSGRIVKRWSNAAVTIDGDDLTGRFVASVTFEIMYIDNLVP